MLAKYPEITGPADSLLWNLRNRVWVCQATAVLCELISSPNCRMVGHSGRAEGTGAFLPPAASQPRLKENRI